jgi:hypothetical protein
MDTASPAGSDVDVDADVLQAAAAAAIEYATSIGDRRVAPGAEALAALATFDEALPEAGADPLSTLRLLHEVGSPATLATTSGRYFGFVIGAAYPVALGTSWLSSAWDQNGALPVMSPVAAKLHDVMQGWLVDLLRLPAGTSVAFVTGATVANASCLAAGRDALLARLGWDAQAEGLFGAPALDVVIGERAHSTVPKALGLVGLGRQRVTVVPADDQGRMRADRLPDLEGPVLVCAQAGDVNTGAFDPFDQLADWLSERSGWLHVDGAFGLWALADPSRAGLVAGLDRADSWATDAHKGPDDPERRRPQPGARPARGRADDRGPHRRDPVRRPHLVRPDPMGRGDGDADQRVVLEDPQRRRHLRRRRDPRLRRPHRLVSPC